MTKIRMPGTVEKTLLECRDILGGTEVVADLIGKSESMVLAYADPDNEARNLPAKYTTILDTACQKRRGTTPFLSLFQRKMVEQPGNVTACLKESVIAVFSAIGQLTANFEAATCPNGPGGAEVVRREAETLLEDIDQIRNRLDQLENAVKHQAGIE